MLARSGENSELRLNIAWDKYAFRWCLAHTVISPVSSLLQYGWLHSRCHYAPRRLPHAGCDGSQWIRTAIDRYVTRHLFPSLRPIAVAELYNRKLDVLVRGFSGYNTSWIIPVFEKVGLRLSTRASGFTQSLQCRSSPKPLTDRTYLGSSSSPSGSAQMTPASPENSNMSHCTNISRTSVL